MFRNKIAIGVLCLGIGLGGFLYPVASIAGRAVDCENTNLVATNDYNKINPISIGQWQRGAYSVENILAYSANKIGCTPSYVEGFVGSDGNDYDYWKFSNPYTGTTIFVVTGQKNGDFVVLGKDIVKSN